MVVDTPAKDKRTDLVFHAFADATRRDIVRRTLVQEFSVSALAREYPMSFAAVQKHVAVLETAGLVTKRRNGREQIVAGNAETIRHAAALLDEFAALWSDRIERMGDVLARDKTKGT